MRKLCLFVTIILCTVLLLSACDSAAQEDIGELTLGQTFEFDGLEIALSRGLGFTRVKNDFSNLDGKYVFYIPTTVTNVGDSSNGLHFWALSIFSPDGTSIDIAQLNTWDFEETSILSIGDLQPGATKSGNLYVLYVEDGEHIIEFDSHNEEEIKLTFDLVFNFDAIPEEPEVQTEFELGEMLVFEGLEITLINDISWGIVMNSWSDHMGEYYFILPVSMRNTSDEAKGFPWGHDIFGPNGNALDSIAWEIDEEDVTQSNDLLPGASSMGYLHVLYVGDGTYTLQLSQWGTEDLNIRIPVEFDPEAAPVLQTEFNLGDTFIFDDLEITISDEIEWSTINARWSEHHRERYFSLPVTITNVGDESNSLGWGTSIFGPNGVELDVITFIIDVDDITRTGDIRPGATLESFLNVLFDGYGEYVLEISDWRNPTIQVFMNVEESD